MAERPPLTGRGRVIATRAADHLYDVEMPNGHRAIAVLAREGPRPGDPDPRGRTALLAFSPYDMSRCRVISWDPAA